MNSMTSTTAAFGRLLLAAIFLISGFGKLADPAGTIGYIEYAGLPLPVLAFGIALIIEIGGGLLLTAGYQTRIAAAGLALFTVVTAFGFHFNLADQNEFIHFLKNLSIAGGLILVAVNGAGRASVDARLATARA